MVDKHTDSSSSVQHSQHPAPFFWLDTGLGEPALNMAFDDALLQCAEELPGPVLRFYGWTVPAATFGYFQHYSEIEKVTLLRPLIRRPSGGGLVPHDADWTYSAVFPKGTEWYEFKAEESYRRIHIWLQQSFQRMGVKTELADCCLKSIPGQCFIGHEKYDLLWQGRKIAGAAQRRTRNALLIQGSIQPVMSGIARDDWQKNLLTIAAEKKPSGSKPFEVFPKFSRKVEALVQSVYTRDDYNRRR